MIEILSAGNKSSNRDFQAFLTNAVESLERGYHLLLIDLQPPTPRDPEGIHAAIWEEFGGKPKSPPTGKPLTLVAYDAGPPKEAYIQRLSFGESLIDMPLFLAPGWYVNVPLEATYQSAWRACRDEFATSSSRAGSPGRHDGRRGRLPECRRYARPSGPVDCSSSSTVCWSNF